MGNLKNRLSENLLIDALSEYYKKRNMEVYLEVPFLSRFIDIIITDKSKKEIFAIEAKISWWDKVIDQAKLTLLGVDKAYIAMPASRMKLLNRYENILSNYGIGVISIECSATNPKIEIVIPASKSTYKSIHRENELIKIIEDGIYLCPKI